MDEIERSGKTGGTDAPITNASQGRLEVNCHSKIRWSFIHY